MSILYCVSKEAAFTTEDYSKAPAPNVQVSGFFNEVEDIVLNIANIISSI